MVDNLVLGLGFIKPERKLYNEIINFIVKSKGELSFQIISGYITEAGFKAIFGDESKWSAMRDNIKYILVGEVTLECANLFDKLIINYGYQGKLWVNLGKSDRNQWKPMIHSKIIAIEDGKGGNLFHIGSANVTERAIMDQNAEAGIIITNEHSDREKQILRYMDELKNLTDADGKPWNVEYRPEDRGKYLALYYESIDKEQSVGYSLIEKIDPEFLLIFCSKKGDEAMHDKDVLYGEIYRNLPEDVKLYHKNLDNIVVFLVIDEDNFNINLMPTVIYTEHKSSNDAISTGRSQNKIQFQIDYPQKPNSFPVITKAVHGESPPISPSNEWVQSKYVVLPDSDERLKIIKKLFSQKTLGNIVRTLFFERHSTKRKLKWVTGKPVIYDKETGTELGPVVFVEYRPGETKYDSIIDDLNEDYYKTSFPTAKKSGYFMWKVKWYEKG